MFNIYKSQELFNCPSCGEVQEYEAGDYTTTRLGSGGVTTYTCYHCFKTIWFGKEVEDLVRVSSSRKGLLL